MSVTTAADALILTATIDASIDNIDVISLKKSSGEFFRKAYQAKETISSTQRKYTFYMTTSEGNDTITGMSLYGNGATTTLGTGTEMATQTASLTKTDTQSLLIYWTVGVA